MVTNLEKTETIKMVESAMAVLELLRTSKEPIGVNAIAKRCGLHSSTTFRILKSLEKTGWVFQLSDNQYIVGSKISFVTNRNNFHIALCDVAGFSMRECTDKYGIAMNLIVLNGSSCEIIQQSLTNSIINYVPPLHSSLPYYACGGGKVLLSTLPDTIIEQIFCLNPPKALTPYTITDTKKYKLELKNTRDNGYAIDFQESSINGSCIAVPVFDIEGTVVASLSFSGLIGISSPDLLLQYLPILQETSKKITDSLYSCWSSDKSAIEVSASKK